MANNQLLNYQIHDDPDAVRLDMAGKLSGSGFQTAYHACHTALSIAGDRAMVVDITSVAEVDKGGRALLQALHQNGARIIAASCGARAVLQPILDELIPAPPPKLGWLRRLCSLIFRRPPTAHSMQARIQSSSSSTRD